MCSSSVAASVDSRAFRAREYKRSIVKLSRRLRNATRKRTQYTNVRGRVRPLLKLNTDLASAIVVYKRKEKKKKHRKDRDFSFFIDVTRTNPTHSLSLCSPLRNAPNIQLSTVPTGSPVSNIFESESHGQKGRENTEDPKRFAQRSQYTIIGMNICRQQGSSGISRGPRTPASSVTRARERDRVHFSHRCCDDYSRYSLSSHQFHVVRPPPPPNPLPQRTLAPQALSAHNCTLSRVSAAAAGGDSLQDKTR